MIPSRALPAVTLLLASVLLGVGCGAGAASARPEADATPARVAAAARAAAAEARPRTTEVSVGQERVVLPGAAGLEPVQQLERALSLPGVRGVVRGRTGSPRTQRSPDAAVLGPGTVTDFPFTVLGFVGLGAAPYATGGTVTLRIAGAPDSGTAHAERRGPRVAAGNEYFVVARDQGAVLGGNTADVLVATADVDVLEVDGGVVRGQGAWAAYAEPVERFVGRLRTPLHG